ncbi:hypothetical protein ACQR0Z_18505 [Bradyrhizobium sp. HKCCYLS3077]
MASWLELFFNILGYGGFVAIASLHHGSDDAQGAPGLRAGEPPRLGGCR